MERVFAGEERLAGVARAAFGSGRRLAGVTRLRGGSKKGVYRAAFGDGGTAIFYIWDASEGYWPDWGRRGSCGAVLARVGARSVRGCPRSPGGGGSPDA